jgi:hypothetical protein
MSPLRFLPAAVLGVILLTGCGSGDGINHGGTLAGRITYKGQPVSSAEIVLYSEDGRHSVAGRSKLDGTYAVTEPPLGRCKVVVRTSQNKGIPPREKVRGPVNLADPITGEWPAYIAIPARYEDPATTPLAIEVRKGNQAEDLDLTD